MASINLYKTTEILSKKKLFEDHNVINKYLIVNKNTWNLVPLEENSILNCVSFSSTSVYLSKSVFNTENSKVKIQSLNDKYLSSSMRVDTEEMQCQVLH
jgi:hypothetical protein